MKGGRKSRLRRKRARQKNRHQEKVRRLVAGLNHQGYIDVTLPKPSLSDVIAQIQQQQ